MVTRIPYRQTGYFNKIVLDYIDQGSSLKDFYTYSPGIGGIRKAIEDRNSFSYNREVLTGVLKKQYQSVPVSGKTAANIEALASPKTFTITTAHQNNLFTGPLYFIYKILHVIRLAEHCSTQLPEYRFVPVFYIGSEDADIEELNHIHIDDKKLSWETKQTGAVGRMIIDKELIKLIRQMEGQLSVLPFGKEIVDLVRDCYKEGDTIESSTFQFINSLFGEWGLVVLIPDNRELKRQLVPVFKDDLLKQTATGIIENTAQRLSAEGYKVQANPREINLFYLGDQFRERITRTNGQYQVLGKETRFTEEELLDELQEHPERFSPNVILRGLYQESILPNLVFVGGGGETAYWLQLKDLFHHYKIPFPLLVLRNSFLITEQKWAEKILKLGFQTEDFFDTESRLMDKLVLREKGAMMKLNGAFSELEELYDGFKKQAVAVDASLAKHVEALKLKTVQQLQELEKKMLRAEKRKLADSRRQVHQIMNHLFPKNGLQERHQNICLYYAKWGRSFIDKLYEASLHFEQEFVILTEK